MTQPRDILCEACGYDLHALLANAHACPECGRTLASSLPDRRTGSPWQIHPGLPAWLATAWALLTHPRQLFQHITIEPRRSLALLAANITVTAAITTAAVILGGPYGMHARPAYAITFFLAGSLALAFLSAVEIFGIRFIGRRHGWRTDLGIAAAVCGHASYGWLVAGAGIAFVWQWHQWCHVLDDWAAEWQCPVMPSQLTPALLALAFLAGLLVFESYVYLGFRVCRYANRAIPPS